MASSLLTYLILKNEIKKKFPKVAIGRSPEYRNAIVRTLEEQLSVDRSRLAPIPASLFDRHVNDFYNHLPSWWGVSPVFWNEKSLLRKHGRWLNNVITLVPPSPMPGNEEQVTKIYLIKSARWRFEYFKAKFF